MVVLSGVLGALIALYFSKSSQQGRSLSRFADYEHRDIQIRDAEGSLGRIAGGLQYRTVSNSNLSNHVESLDTFKGLHAHLKKSFPRVHRELQLKKVPCYTHSLHVNVIQHSELRNFDAAFLSPGERVELAVQVARAKVLP